MSYLLTVSRTDYSARKARWNSEGYAPGVRKFGTASLPLAYPGVLAHVDDRGEIAQAVPLWSPKGMHYLDGNLLVACYSEVRVLSLDLSKSESYINEPWCNDLHSLRASSRGTLMAVSGIDLAVEFAADRSLEWHWWAADHGFDVDISGRPWDFDRTGDHRMYSYPIDLQSTHINAIAELNEQTLVATLLHKNCLIAIDRISGASLVLLDGLGRPHAVRVSAEGEITLTDTLAGRALRGRVVDDKFVLDNSITCDSSWIHDAFFDGESWLVADGANSRVLHVSDEGEVMQVDQFDPEWCLYEVLPFPEPAA